LRVGKPELDNLVKIGSLKAEPPSRVEFDGMVKSARSGLKDAQSEHIETDSRFVLATEAAHKFALAALRREGYRSENRITVSRPSFTLRVYRRRTFRSSLQPTTNEIWPHTKAAWISTKRFSRSSSRPRNGSRPQSESSFRRRNSSRLQNALLQQSRRPNGRNGDIGYGEDRERAGDLPFNPMVATVRPVACTDIPPHGRAARSAPWCPVAGKSTPAAPGRPAWRDLRSPSRARICSRRGTVSSRNV
jgi:hypothetical protein